MLRMAGKCIRHGMCLAVHRYEKRNNKYMRDYDPNKELTTDMDE